MKPLSQLDTVKCVSMRERRDISWLKHMTHKACVRPMTKTCFKTLKQCLFVDYRDAV